jgi:tetratricopeptide (TPR) repeat protein
VWAFRKAVDEGRPEDAVSLYGGRLLEGFHASGLTEFEWWREIEADKLGQLYEGGLTELAVRAELSGDIERAAEWWERLVTHDPFNDNAVNHLMSSLLALGNRGRAIRVAERYVTRMREDLGAEPSQETIALIAELRSDDEGLDSFRERAAKADRHSDHPVPTVLIGKGAKRQNVVPSQSTVSGWISSLSKRWLRWLVGVCVAVAIVVSVLMAVGQIPQGRGDTAPAIVLALHLTENTGGFPLGEGILDDIGFRLARTRGLRLVEYDGAYSGSASVWNARELGQRLVVPLALFIQIHHEPESSGEASVLARCELIRTENGERVWTATFVRPLTEASSIAADLSRDLLSVLSLSQSDGAGRTDGPATVQPAAYFAYARGVGAYTEGAYLTAAAEFEEAVRLDSGFVLAYLRLAEANLRAVVALQDPGHERLEQARRIATEAVRLSPHLPEARWTLGDFYLSGDDYRRALEEYIGNDDVDTNNVDLLFRVAHAQAGQGLLDSATATMNRVVQLQPHSAKYRRFLAHVLAVAHDFHEATQQLDKVSEHGAADPSSQLERVLLELIQRGDVEGARLWFRRALGSFSAAELCAAGASQLNAHLRPVTRILLDECVEPFQEGDGSGLNIDAAALYIAKAGLFSTFNSPGVERAYYDSARVVLEQRVARWPDVAAYHRDLGLVYAGLGRVEQAIREGRLAIVLMPERKCALTAWLQVAAMARIYAMIGDFESAITELSALVSMPSWVSPHLLRLDPAWSPLADDPRFQRLVGENRP